MENLRYNYCYARPLSLPFAGNGRVAHMLFTPHVQLRREVVLAATVYEAFYKKSGDEEKESVVYT